MNLKLANLEYVALKQSMGMRFQTEATLLRAFVKQMGDAVAVAAVTSTNVNRYLTGRKAEPVTLFWHRKHDALKGFWEFAIRRGYTDRSPVPVRRAKEPVPFVPYIYSREELKRLLDGVTSYQKKWLKLEPITFRAMLLLIYGAGLRASEALHLTCADVDLSALTLTIGVSKFYKTRRIALNTQLCSVLAEYGHNRQQKECDRSDAAPFFTYMDGSAVVYWALEDAFLRLRNHVGVKRQNTRYQPRLHDLRHTFAVHRLTAWYRTGADVQSLLPGLSTHLGHVCLKGTQRYLTMTPELLAEASLRFEGYAEEVLHG
ncbi:MAG: tyrosine-type recombinase/integrase [Acidobacteriota bacterium]|nr:tyrosine-type recombinase/integrase [Acidobacteriota bacterium]